ncbi:MAG: Mu transposase C-terminal domain-containing protein [Defluviicoccus sp.]|nr:Mu transposase C-terminal domain-containing protein [Defluviicoccus sp.]
MSACWHRTAELVGLPGMPNGPRPIQLHGPRRGWVCREARWGRRRVLEWLETSLPAETQAALRGAAAPAPDAPLPFVLPPDDTRGAIADARVEILAAFEAWRRARGLPLVRALREWAEIYKATGAGVSEETSALIPSVAWNTMQRWRAAHAARKLTGLVPGSGGRVSGIDADPELRALLEGCLFDNPHHITAAHLLEAVEARLPDREPPSISQVRRFARRWRAENAEAISAVADPDGHRSRSRPAFGSASEAVEGLNALWELDSTIADVMCGDGKRYALIGGIDVWSRRPKALVAPTSRAAAIAALVRRCLLDWGAPRIVKTDQGADYVSQHLRHVWLDLGIEHIPVGKFSPEKKPFIERFFGTLSRDLFCRLEGFTGHNVAQAERLRSRKAFAQQCGDEPVATFRCALTPEELQARIETWCQAIYERRTHGGLDGLSPFQKAASWTGERRRVDERGLDILLAPPAGNGERTVWKEGIKLGGRHYIAPELGHWMRRKVHVRHDPADWRRIFVFTLTVPRTFICIAEDCMAPGVDRQGIAARAVANWQADNRGHRKKARDLAREHRPGSIAGEVLDRAARRADDVIAFPAPAERHESDGLAAAAQAQDAADAADSPQEQRNTGTGGRDRFLAAARRFYREKLDD